MRGRQGRPGLAKHLCRHLHLLLLPRRCCALQPLCNQGCQRRQFSLPKIQPLPLASGALLAILSADTCWWGTLPGNLVGGRRRLGGTLQ